MNQLIRLPSIPFRLQRLYCSDNQLISLPSLPFTLQQFDCSQNQLTHLPPLPSTLQTLVCSDNPLTSLPPLPPGLQKFYFSHDQNKIVTATDIQNTVNATRLDAWNTTRREKFVKQAKDMTDFIEKEFGEKSKENAALKEELLRMQESQTTLLDLIDNLLVQNTVLEEERKARNTSVASVMTTLTNLHIQ